MAAVLAGCAPPSLRRVLLLRESPLLFCRHEAASCRQQRSQIWSALLAKWYRVVAVRCSICHKPTGTGDKPTGRSSGRTRAPFKDLPPERM